ncbi:MAG: hypothetical protein IT561_24070 [Alphaproteobacteria bacterium]|nr:hypothetical protein [Alphaproteobacteria bacterium]
MRLALAPVLVLLLAVSPASAQQATAYVETFDAGPPERMLQGALTLGADGPWTGTVRDGAYVLANPGADGVVRYHFLDAVPTAPGARLDQATVEAVVDVHGEGQLSGAGVLVRFDPAARTYHLFVVGPMGYALIQRAADGVTIPLSGSSGAIRRDGPNTVTARPGADGVEFLVNGTRLFTYKTEGVAGTAVGIGAVGRGTFRFDRVAVVPAGTLADAPPTPRPQPSAPPPQQQTVLQPQGEPGWFTIGVPAGWQLHANRDAGQIAVAGPGESVHLRPFFLPGALDEPKARAVLAAYAREIAGRTAWNAPSRQDAPGRPGLRMVGRDGDQLRVAAVGLVPVQGGAAGIFWMASSRGDHFARSAPLLAAVLESFRPMAGSAPAGGAPGTPAWVRWTDPREGAFSTDVPQGWKVAGGTVRAAAVDVRHAIRVESPDGAVICSVGDAEIPPFVEPSAMLREGTWYNPLAVNMLVQRYLPGEHFAAWYMQWRLGQIGAEGLRIEAANPLPEATRAANAARPAFAGIQMRADVGEARASGRLRGAPMRAYAYAATQRTGMADAGAQWNVTSIIGFVAREDRVGEAVAVLTHMLAAAEVNPQWVARQQGTTAEVSRITADTNRYVSSIISRSYADRSARMDRVFERGSQARRGVVQLQDPQTGQRYEVEAGSDYHWITDSGVIAGTNTHANPDGLWFREMLRIEP